MVLAGPELFAITEFHCMFLNIILHKPHAQLDDNL